ncbi:DUF1049 domain-containing protein [Idiomarina tyrosinivorans]|uniref:DUF1049 domain-containing protein n=1 Tax=Idiomarina tyrosinivorans TaxID=1445662 RepID=A0A432ZTY1_9GAMM|nr:lipopolysaccharide assembly protein LapA domain-containing protein [Idiomarina tyrosinivorans]RUO81367.1 DUF1049 domain-containing protein [Idiomarina tyrosinivorans]
MLKRLLILLPIITVLLFAIAFGANNPQSVTVNLLFVQKQLTVAELMAYFLAIGIGLGLLMMLLSNWKWRIKASRAEKKLQRLQKDSTDSAC